MPTAHRAVQEYDIEPYRADALRVMRGFFAIAFGPLYLLMMMLVAVVADLPDLNTAPFKDPVFWIAAVAAGAGLVVMRRYSGAFDAKALKVLLGGAWGLATLSIAFMLVKLEQEIWDFDERSAQVMTVVAILMTAGLGLMLHWLVVAPCLAALRLLSATFPALQVRLTDVIGNAGGVRSADAAIPKPSKPTRLSLALKGLACLLGAAGSAAVVWFLSQEEIATGAAFEIATLIAAAAVWRFARRMEAIDDRALLSLDKRPPILFLRSFQDDGRGLEQEWGLIGKLSATGKPKRQDTALARLAGRLGGTRAMSGLRLEETLAQAVSRLGPFVGIGAPGEALPELGAARAYFSNETWQSAIVGWVDAAQLIVKIAGSTRWIRWELDTILHRQAWPKLLILFPHCEAADRAARWENIAGELADTPWQRAFSELDRDRVIALRLLGDGRVAVVSSGSRRVIDFLLATRILLYTMQVAAPDTAPPAPASPRPARLRSPARQP